MGRFKGIFLLLALFVAYSQQHSYSLGECPSVTPMADFHMSKMLGVWYVIKKTSTSSSCITYNFTATDEPDTYQIEQTSNTFIPGNDAYHYTGELTVPDTGIPARMKVKFPLNFGSASYTVFMTDYDTVAAIFTCQKLAITNRQSVSIISRNRYLDKAWLDKVQDKLRTFNINPYDLSIISQKNCDKTGEGYNINIDSDTFSTKSIAGVVRKAGEKLGDGIEYVADGAKKLYKDHSEDVKEGAQKLKTGITNPDAEWIP